MEASRAQLDRHERRLDEHDEELEVIRGRLDRVAVEIGGIPDEIGRDPNRLSLRQRLHLIETDRSAAKTAQAAVSAASKLRDDAREKAAQAEENRFSRREKLAALAFAAIVAAGPYLSPLLFHAR